MGVLTQELASGRFKSNHVLYLVRRIETARSRDPGWHHPLPIHTQVDRVILEPAVVLHISRGNRKRFAALEWFHLYPADLVEVNLGPSVRVAIVVAHIE
jgi:hypothetical protein